jgi:hypothetical protein
MAESRLAQFAGILESNRGMQPSQESTLVGLMLSQAFDT